ncbi:Coleoptile phototropism protein 1 [Sesbania bispinosa]|nr:Coleoptile phototropism protein 1 [Sesbania bispinosa]
MASGELSLAATICYGGVLVTFPAIAVTCEGFLRRRRRWSVKINESPHFFVPVAGVEARL